MRSGVFQARESSEAREGRLARGEGGGRVHSLRPLVTEPSPRCSKRAGRWARAAGVPGPGRPLLGFSLPQLRSSLSAFVLRVLVGSELAECAFPHTVPLVSAVERWLKKEKVPSQLSFSKPARVRELV